jgi:cobalt/nickel transport system permease protein
MATVAKLQLGYHLLIGIGEGVITAMTVGAVAATRPDLVWALRRHATRQRPADDLVEA